MGALGACWDSPPAAAVPRASRAPTQGCPAHPPREAVSSAELCDCPPIPRAFPCCLLTWQGRVLRLPPSHSRGGGLSGGHDGKHSVLSTESTALNRCCLLSLPQMLLLSMRILEARLGRVAFLPKVVLGCSVFSETRVTRRTIDRLTENSSGARTTSILSCNYHLY